MGSAKTRFSFSPEAATAVRADVLIVPVFKKAEPVGSKKTDKKADPLASIVWPLRFDKALQDELNVIATDEKFDGSRGKLLTLRQSAANKLKVRRLVLLGLGDGAKLQPKHWEANLQKAVAGVLSLKDMKSVAILLPSATDGLSDAVGVSLAVDAVTQATYKSAEAKEPPTDLKQALLLSTNGTKLSGVLKQAQALAQARTLVKDLVNRPANLKSTATLVDQAKTIGKAGIQVNIQSNTAWIEKNMPCFYTVARGSVATDPPKFITLRYTPKGGKAKKHIAVVGKSVIFDTGGYQVKPGDYMVTMKGDMTGGAVALATMQALAELQPQNVEVTAYLAATPNKIDSDAMVPDSIVNTTCGKKVEIRHTDAEGRLTLIDAVAKALENKPDEILTIATLTGSASAAVGYTIALMGNNQALRDRVEQAGRSLGEPIQTLDVVEEDYDNIKSKLDGADIINTSQRKHRGAQSAAAFVMSGAPEEMPMAHMDIAGADMTADEKATGISVKTVLQYILNEDASFGGGKTPSTGSPAATKSASKPAPAKAVARKPAPKPVSGKAASKSSSTKSATKPAIKAVAKPAVKAVAKKASPAKPAAKGSAKPANRKK